MRYDRSIKWFGAISRQRLHFDFRKTEAVHSPLICTLEGGDTRMNRIKICARIYTGLLFIYVFGIPLLETILDCRLSKGNAAHGFCFASGLLC